MQNKRSHNIDQLLEGLFPGGVSGALLFPDDDVIQEIKLHPEEIQLSNCFQHPARKELFVLGRKAARLALERSGGASDGPVLKGGRDEPLWPDGYTGSITHTRGVAIAVVARTEKYQSIGIDVERTDKSLGLGLIKRILRPEEERPELSLSDQLELLLRTFSAKESFYKAFYPLTKNFLGFRDVELVWDADGAYSGRVHKQENSSSFLIQGRAITIAEFIYSSAFVLNKSS